MFLINEYVSYLQVHSNKEMDFLFFLFFWLKPQSKVRQKILRIFIFTNYYFYLNFSISIYIRLQFLPLSPKNFTCIFKKQETYPNI